MRISKSIGERWHIDTWGPFNDNYKKYYIICAVKALTKYFVAKVFTNKSMKTYSSFIMNEIVYRYGVPKVIVSDQANEIPGLQNDLMKALGIRRIITRAYAARSNGEIEKT